MRTIYFSDIENFKDCIENVNEDFFLDVTSMNIFDSVRCLVLSSIYFQQKKPDKKLKCRTNSNDTENLLADFKICNLEFV